MGRGDLGPFVVACLIWEFKKKGEKWPRDVVKVRKGLLGSLALLSFFFSISNSSSTNSNAVPT